MKFTKLFCMLVFVLSLICVLASCGGTTISYESFDTTDAFEDSESREPVALESKLNDANFETPYSELFALYSECVEHQKSCADCELDLAGLLENMLYGEWKDSDENYISFTYAYENYDNTDGNTWYGTNLQTSKIYGNTYYYYTEAEGNQLIIGYEDKITEEKTDNFVITFEENAISVLNKNDATTYHLKANQAYTKVQKGNAKLAYIYIAKQIFNFKVPSSVNVVSCHVDYDTKTVYATTQAANSFGGLVNTDYKFYESNGRYYCEEYSYDYATNIDLAELNEKLQAYVSTGG